MRRDLIFCSEAWCKLSQRRCCNAVTPHSQYEHGVVQLESPFFVRIVTHQGRVGKRKIHTGVPTTAQGNARNDKRTALHVLPLPCFFSTLPARPPFLPALRHALFFWYSAPPPPSHDAACARKVYDPKRAGLYDADDVILFEHVPADVVFEPPPDLAAWLLETSQSIETDKSSGAPPKEGQARVWRPSLPSIALTATLLTVVGLTMRARLRRRARTRREKFAHALDRLDRGWKACAGDPARAPGMCRGHPRDRKVKVEAELVHVRGVMADYLGPDKRCPRELRGEDLAEKLSQRLARLQRAADELQVMLEVKRVIDALDAAEIFREGQAGGGRFSRADDRGLEVRRGEGDGGDVDDGDGDNDGIVQADRLATRAKSARYTPAIDGIARRSRCVFSDELDACCEELDKQEHFATDALKEGLQLWDLEKVDTAMAKLKLLELPDLVSKFQTARRAVWIKIERLRNELNVRGGGEGRGAQGVKGFLLVVRIEKYSWLVE